MPTILVTGANRGIGLELSRQYAEDGWTVHGTARDPAGAKALVSTGASVHAMDVTQRAQINAVANSLQGTAIDVLVNNAGFWLGKEEQLGRFTNAQWMEECRVHIMGTFAVCEAFVDHVAASKRKLMVNISSGNGSFGWDRGAGDYPYDTSKAALNLVTKGLSTDLKDRGITVISMTPGNVQTDMSGPNAELTPEQSITGMRQVIAGLTLAQSGTFWRYNGEAMPW